MKTKEMAFRPGTSDHDLGHKVKKIREFLDEGDRVKLIVKFRGREMVHLDKGMETINRALKYLEPFRIVNGGRQDGRQYSIVIAPR